MSTEIGSLLIDMRADVARLSQDMNKVASTVDNTMRGVQRAASGAVTALGLIGAGVSVAGMVGIVKGAVGAMAALDDMAAVAGTTVENMSALAEVAAIGGHNLGMVESTMVRLTKALAGGDDEAKGAGHALEVLGLKAEELRKMDTAEALLVVAKALDEYKDGAGKTALMLDLLGKSGAAAIPFMQDLAEKGRLNASVTAEQAAKAEQLEKDLNAVKVEGDKLTRALVAGMLPAMGDIAKAMRLAAEDGGTLKALFVGFGGVADQFATPWKAAFLGLGAGLNEMLATFEEGLAKITFGGVAERHIKAALQYREAARQMNIEIANLDRRKPSASAGADKPELEYTKPPGSDGGAGKKSPLDRMLEEQRKRIAEINARAGDEQMVSVDSVSRQYEKSELDSLEKRRIAMEAMAEQRMEDTRIATEGEEAIREAMKKTAHQADNLFGEMSEFAREAARNMQDAMADGFFDLLQGKFDNIGSRFKSMLDRMVANAMAARLSDAMFGDFGKSGKLGGLAGEAMSGGGDWFRGLFGGGDGAAAGTWANAGANNVFAAGGDHGGGYRLVGENGPELEATGPSRIYNAAQTRDILSGGGGGTGEIRVELINSGTPQKVTGAQPSFDMKGMVLRIFTEDIAQGGRASKQMESTYGLNRAAGAM